MRLLSAVLRRGGAAVVVAAVASLCVWASSAGASAPTKEQYIATADALCRSADRQIAAVVNGRDGATGPASLVKAEARELSKASGIQKASLRKLRALPRPSSSAAAASTVWDALARDASDTGKLAVDFMHPHGTAVIQQTNAGSAAAAKYYRLAASYGFRVCGHGSSDSV